MNKPKAVNTDPDFETMDEHLVEKFPDSDEFDRCEAIHWFASFYHGGQWTNLYKVLSLSKFKPGITSRYPERGSVSHQCYNELRREFST